MLCFETQSSGLVPSQNENWPAHIQPLYLMHSSLPGSGYDSKLVLFADFQVSPAALHGSPPLGLPPLLSPPELLPALPPEPLPPLELPPEALPPEGVPPLGLPPPEL